MLAKNLLLARVSAGLTQEQLAQKIGKSKSAVMYYEKGRTKPNDATLRDIAIALETEISILTKGTGDMKMAVVDVRTNEDMENTVKSQVAALIETARDNAEALKTAVDSNAKLAESNILLANMLNKALQDK